MMRFLRQHILHPFLLFACLWVNRFFLKVGFKVETAVHVRTANGRL
jgi:hypothetical protein